MVAESRLSFVDPAPGGLTPDRVGLLWLVTVRWTTLVACLGAVAAGESGLVAGVPLVTSGVLLAALAVSNLWLTWRIRKPRGTTSKALPGCFIGADVVLLSWVLLRTGGVLNPASVFYLVEIVVAALVLGQFWTWIVTGLSVCGYAALFLGQTDELRLAQGMHPEIALHMRGMWIAFAATALIVGLLVSRLAVAIERRDRALELLRERSVKASRLAGLATVVAGAAHELSTPLSTIAVAARELERSVSRASADDDLVADAQLIRREIDRCRRVLDDMAGRIAEPMGEAPRATRVADVVAAVLEACATAERARVRVACPSDIAVVWPAGVVARALGNLLRNALQASGPGIPVDLQAVADVDERVRLTVVDTGRGMSPEELVRAGEPFFTTKAPGEGTGLGLFVTRSTIEQLKGTLDLSSTLGQGTSATIVLPRDLRD